MPSALEYLLNRYADKTGTSEEKEQLMQLLQQAGNDEAVRQLIDKMLVERAVTHTMPEANARAVLETIFATAAAPVIPLEGAPVRRLPVKRIAAAAVIVGVIAVAGWFWLNSHPKTSVAKTEERPVIKNDVAPGGNKAMLTLANGKSIVLDNAANGTVASEGNAKVVKLSNGQLAYTVAGDGASTKAEVIYNTLSTPRGGQYQLALPDGSKVWLNSASSITFPTAFTGNERKVVITGEAYFEVAKLSLSTGQKMPFKVEKGNVTIEVLGTHFNVNAYDDEEAIRTTLLEGKVKTSMVNGQSAILTPGQQAQVNNGGSIKVLNDADLDEVMAWKNGLFHFENADIKTVMRQLSRWYDIDVEYKGAIKNEPLFIEIPRNTNLLDVLKVIGSTAGLRLTLEGKKVTVL